MREDSSYQVYANRYFAVDQCRDCSVPGYLIVSALEKAAQLSELSAEAAVALGPTLAHAVVVIEEVVEPIKIYCAQFGEENSQLHFHVFPRTRKITEEYLEERPEEAQLIHGPVLLDWARGRYKCTSPTQPVRNSIAEMRRLFSDAA